MNQIVLELPPTTRNARNSEATFVTLNSGRILYAWSKFNTADNSDDGPAIIAGRYSDDNGRTWSTRDRTLVENEGTNVMSPSLLRLQDGRILLLYLRKDGRTSCVPYVRFSRDEAQTFTKPILVTPILGCYVVNNDRLVQLRSGRIMIPVAWHRMRIRSEMVRARSPQPFLGPSALIFFYFSDNGGRNWLESLTSYYHCSATGHGLQEPGLVELKDGRLWSWTRSGAVVPGERTGRQWESFSADAGQVWSAPKPSRFQSPCSPMQVKRIPSTGHLLAVWNDHSGRFTLPKPKPISRRSR